MGSWLYVRPRRFLDVTGDQSAMASGEVLNTQLKTWDCRFHVADSIARAYELMALYAEHTWGGAASVNEYGDAFKKLPASNLLTWKHPGMIKPVISVMPGIFQPFETG
jgi:hypothetical protein